MNPSQTSRFWPGIWVAVALAAAAGFIFLFNPAGSKLYPPCVFHWLAGLFCPGCGSTRAIHQLLHGNLAGAFDLNPLLVALIPVIAVVYLLDRLGNAPGRSVLSNPIFAWSMVAVVVSFAVLRNLPFPLFERLAP